MFKFSLNEAVIIRQLDSCPAGPLIGSMMSLVLSEAALF